MALFDMLLRLLSNYSVMQQTFDEYFPLHYFQMIHFALENITRPLRLVAVSN